MDVRAGRDATCIRRLLVTGGCGFIGTNFVRMVCREHPEVGVVVLDRLTYAANPEGVLGLGAGRVELVRGDVCDAALVDDLVSRVDAVVHFAAETHVDRSIADPAPFFEANLRGTFCLLEACRRHGRRLHHVSTDEVFGDLALDDPSRFDEASPYRPSSPYASTKAGSDLLVKAWARTYGLYATVSNSSNNYGPYQHVEKFIPRTVTSVLRGERPVLYGDGANVRDWIHVEDNCRAIWEVLVRGRAGESYLVGAGCERSNLEVMRAVLRLMGAEGKGFERVGDRAGHDVRYAIDAGKVCRELGWRPLHTDFTEGLRQTIHWYEQHEGWWREARDRSEARYASEALKGA